MPKPYQPMSTLEPRLKSSRVEVAAAMTAVSAGSTFRADTSYIYSDGEPGCIQGALLATLGYPFNKEHRYVGGYRDVARALGLEDDEDLKAALAVAQHANDVRLHWSVAGRMFEDVLTGRRTQAQVYAELSPVHYSGPTYSLHAADITTVNSAMKAIQDQVALMHKAISSMTLSLPELTFPKAHPKPTIKGHSIVSSWTDEITFDPAFKWEPAEKPELVDAH